MLCFALLANAQYQLEWNEHCYLELPDPPYNGYMISAIWNVNNNCLTFHETSEVGAIIYPNHYFEGTSIVTCNYRYEYYRNGRMYTSTGIASFSIQFKSKQVVLNKSEISLNIGQTEKISASFPGVTYIPSGANMKWESSDSDIVSVSSSGSGSTNWSATVKALKSGKAKITFDPVIGPPQTCVVNVAYIAPEKATLKPNPLNVTVGKTQKFQISYSPEGASAKSIVWESSNTNIATVSSTGVVKGIAEGKATVTATTDNGVKCSAEINVLPLPTSVSLPSSVTVNVGYSQTLTPTLTPSNSECTYKWSSSNTSIATVSSGKVTGVKAGTTTISVTTENGKTATCQVIVQTTPVELNAKNAGNRATVIENMVKRLLK